MKISEGDIKFIRETLMPLTRIKKMRLAYNFSSRKWPDIWITLNKIPTITITDEWRRQNMHERRKRLVHEFLHIQGLEHNEKIGYNSYPQYDSYSRTIYRKILDGI